MNTFKILLLIIAIVSMTGCKKWLDVAPKTELKADVLFSTQTGYRDALVGVYSLMTTASSYGSELSMGFVDVLAQTYDNVRGTVNHNFLNSANFNYTELKEENRIRGIWKQQYKAITNINILLSKIDDNKQVFKGKNYSLIKGEALGLRAFLHFDLLRLFAPAPVTGKERKAIPYVDTYTNIPFPQLTVGQVMDEIAADLEAAHSLLKSSDPYAPDYVAVSAAATEEIAGTRVSRMNYYAVAALLARVELYRNNKSAALLYAREVMDSKRFPLFELSNNPANPATKADYIFPSEHIFSLSVTDLKTKYADIYFPEVANVQNPNLLSLKNTTLAGIYPAGLNADYRNNWFESNSATTKRVSKYTYNTKIPLIRISEMHLVAAECEPLVSDAMIHLNAFRAHRGLAPLDPALYVRESLDAEIGKEYRREFVSEGQLFFYYKRINVDKIPAIPAFSNKEAVYTLPIPVVEKEFGNIG